MRAAAFILHLTTAALCAAWGWNRWLLGAWGAPFSPLFPAAIAGGLLLLLGAVLSAVSARPWMAWALVAGSLVLTSTAALRVLLVMGATPDRLGPLDAVSFGLPLASLVAAVWLRGPRSTRTATAL
jgi:hypothetical protein